MSQRRQMTDDDSFKMMEQTSLHLESVHLEKNLARNVAHRSCKIPEVAINLFSIETIRAEARNFQFMRIAKVQGAKVAKPRNVVLSPLALIIPQAEL